MSFRARKHCLLPGLGQERVPRPSRRPGAIMSQPPLARPMTWLAEVLRAAGLKVEEVAGWQRRGRGDMGTVLGILCHHTGGPLKGDHPSLDLVVRGRADLAGPLSHLVLGRDGTFVVVAAGRCNHAGVGEWQGITNGNSSFIGIEAENAGTTADPWPVVQIDAYARGCAAILAHLDRKAIMVAGHREYALPHGRKIDPLFDMDAFRTRVEGIMTTARRVRPLPVVAPEGMMLRRGDACASVKQLQGRLGLVQDGVFGERTEQAVKIFQADRGLRADGLVGPATWASLLA